MHDTLPGPCAHNIARTPPAVTSLTDLGIRLRQDRPGEHRAPCPECGRAKHRPRDNALAVKLEPDGGATWVCHRCLWAGGLPASGRERRRERPSPPMVTPLREPEPEPYTAELAREIWRGSVDLCAGAAGGVAMRYLRERRGLSWWDADRLRWHSRCPWEGGSRGAIVAPVNDAATGLVTGVWRILPQLAGPVERRGLGPTKGNASRLCWAAGPLLAVAEGVEDALAYHELSGVPAWAALSAGNMAVLALPARFAEVHVVADTDATGREHAARLVRRLRAEGRKAQMIEPVGLKDANAVLLAGRNAA
jgi:putative DNA primase/helicase